MSSDGKDRCAVGHSERVCLDCGRSRVHTSCYQPFSALPRSPTNPNVRIPARVSGHPLRVRAEAT